MNDRNLLDSSAKIVRDRITPESDLYPLVQGSVSRDQGENAASMSFSPRRVDMKLPASERLARAVEWGQPQVGDIPPQPPTLRGRVGAVLVKLVRRMLFWYTGQLRTFHGGVAEAVGEQARFLLELNAGQQALEPLRALAERLDEAAAFDRDHAQELRDKQDELNHSLARQAEWWDEARRYRAWVMDRLNQIAEVEAASLQRESQHREQLAERLNEMDRTLVASERSHTAILQGERQRSEALAGRLDRAEQDQIHFAAADHRRRESMADHLTRIDEAQTALAGEARREREAADTRLQHIEHLVHASRQEVTGSVGTELHDMRRELHEAGAQLLQQQLRLTMLLREARGNRLAENAARPDSAIADEMRHLHDPLLADYARVFRGSRSEIKNRLSVYLRRAQEAFAATANAPALDLGCGRGEWLEILRDAAIPARGIDTNREIIRDCREQGLDAQEGAVPQILSSLPDQSFSMVTAFHVLEHIPFADLLEVIDQAVRLLKPGGIAIFETPNPKNLLVSTNNFYLDPTHHHPLPSEFLAFVIESRGLCEPEVIPLSPYPECFHLQGTDCPAVEFINQRFFGPQDYGIVARKV